MKLVRPLLLKVAAGAIALAGVAGTAQARDIYWSVGIDAAPGVTLGVGNHRPVVVAPAPVYVAPPPVYVAPPPVYVAPPPVVVYSSGYHHAEPVYYYGKPKHKKWRSKHRHWHHR